jgi:hypothetical protein
VASLPARKVLISAISRWLTAVAHSCLVSKVGVLAARLSVNRPGSLLYQFDLLFRYNRMSIS